MRKKMYASLQLKRAGRQYPAVLLITALTMCVILLVGLLALGSFTHSEDKQKINIGIVGDISDSYLGVGVFALKNMDSSRFSISFLEMDEAAARRALEAREVTGYIKVPDEFVNGIINGENVPATFVTYGGPEGFGSVLTGEITGTVSDLVTECQRAMYAMQDLAWEKGETEGLWDKVKTLNIEYIAFILSRTETYGVEPLGIADSVSMGGYYICGILVFFLLLWGIAAGRFFTGRNLGMQKQLASRGMGAQGQILCEYFAYFVITFFTLWLLCLAAGAAVSKNDFGIRELEGASFLSPLAFFFKGIPVFLMMTAMQVCLYELTSSSVSALLLQFLATLGMGYLSGCLYPMTFFPVALQRIGSILPAGVGFSYLRQSLYTVPDGGTWIMLVLYTILFLVMAALVRKCRMAGDGK